MALHDSSIIELRGVSRFPPRNERPLESAVHEIDLRVAPGSLLWLEGPAGGGKELLFRLLSLSEFTEAGEVLVEARCCQALPHPEIAELRARKFGFVAAAPFLIPTFNAIENIAVPMLKITHKTMPEAQDRIAELLAFTGLVGKEERPAAELCALDQARLTLARALANEPVAIFVEDLEGVLAPDETAVLTDLLRRACSTFGPAVIALGGGAAPDERRVEIADGRIERDSALFGSSIASGLPSA
ncbi:MAG TPA: ATP-binding cassette domain-containing protein [Chthoniobacteraceae bacterium]|jgi:lipoprotein-releasing system ATP-binding protein|nr:ATP-binding cassette domain-containing protein [Chthoniobacteraceae bacterium]